MNSFHSTPVLRMFPSSHCFLWLHINLDLMRVNAGFLYLMKLSVLQPPKGN